MAEKKQAPVGKRGPFEALDADRDSIPSFPPDDNAEPKTLPEYTEDHFDILEELSETWNVSCPRCQNAFARVRKNDGVFFCPSCSSGKSEPLATLAKAEGWEAPPAGAGEKISTLTSSDLLNMDFPEIPMLIEGIIPSEGLGILAAPPKIGKSWLGLGLVYAASSGGYVFGKYKLEKRKCLYFPLEDGPRRIKKRLLSMKAKPCDDLIFSFDPWPTDMHPEEYLEKMLSEYPDVKIIIIDDTRSATPATIDENSKDFGKYWKPVQRLALERGILILMLFHNRKQQHEDRFQMISGSTSFLGIADFAILLTRERGKSSAVLYVTSRDFEENSFTMEFDRDVMQWCIIGPTAEVAASNEQQDILDLLKAESPLKSKDIAAALGKNENTIRCLLAKLVKAEKINNMQGIGYYPITHQHPPTGSTGANTHQHSKHDLNSNVGVLVGVGGVGGNTANIEEAPY